MIGNEEDIHEALTCGNWQTEEQAEQFFIEFVNATGLFGVYRQIEGVALWKHHFQKYNGLRADVLLFPSAKLAAAGWASGCIVVEIKRSGEKIGPGISQLLDYMNAAWRLPGGSVIPSFGFILPAIKQHGPLASVMSHQHVGTAFPDRDAIKFQCGELTVLRAYRDGRVQLGGLDFGLKTGSR
ncbi:MAG: hypothetical protein HZA50_13875 [Planctomycetes bacterium]|nr:hypothetical protein [Planctomycetota bacterium]